MSWLVCQCLLHCAWAHIFLGNEFQAKISSKILTPHLSPQPSTAGLLFFPESPLIPSLLHPPPTLKYLPVEIISHQNDHLFIPATKLVEGNMRSLKGSAHLSADPSFIHLTSLNRLTNTAWAPNSCQAYCR